MPDSFNAYMRAKDVTHRYRAERDAATARLEKALYEERMAELLSQHEPLATIGLSTWRREVEQVIHFIKTGRTK